MPDAPAIRPQASLVRVHDGDTYLFLLDLHARGLGEDGCETAWVRLRGYSARELSDVAPEDPKQLGRVDGPAAQQLAEQALKAAKRITVELQGPAGAPSESFGRLVATVYVDGAELGAVLAANHAVSPGAFEGLGDSFAPGFQTGGIIPTPEGTHVQRVGGADG